VDVWTQLAALAVVTSRVSLGPLWPQPVPPGPACWRGCGVVDEVSGGRLVFGIGAGWNEVEFRASASRSTGFFRVEEAFEIVRRLLTGEHVTFRGGFHGSRTRLLPPPARKIR